MTAQKTGSTDASDHLVEEFRAFLGKEGLKATRQRDLIVRVFADCKDHIGVEDLVQLVKQQDAAVGYATVYRTLKLLVQAGLASVRHFGDGFARFEPRHEEHHDHMICEKCGTIAEFHNEKIEELQEEVVRSRGWTLRRHRHELYGLCPNCR